MDNNKKKGLTSVISIVVLLFMILSAVFTLIPGGMGFIEVIKKITIFTSMIILGGVLIVLFIKGSTLKKGPRTVCAVMGVIAVIVGFINVYNGTRGLMTGLQTVSTERYELYSPTRTKGIKEYYIKTVINGEVTKISLDYPTFERLKSVGGTISISYYPYINIADEVIVE